VRTCKTLTISIALALGVATSIARAQDAELEIPPDPIALDPVLSGSVYTGLVFPVERSALCPGESDCVFLPGGAVGLFVERRWPSGPALGLGYEVWFVDSSGVYELGIMQELRAQVRYSFLQSSNFHPFIGLGIGALIFGDTLKIATAGVAIDLLLGLELELTEVIGVYIGLPWRFFRTTPFTTPRDRVRRADAEGINIATSVIVALTITEAP
jgi:hypothetical protein